MNRTVSSTICALLDAVCRRPASAVLAVFAVVLCSCGKPPYTLVEAGMRDIDDAFTVNLTRPWNRATYLPGEQWVAFGTELGRLGFYAGIEDGEPLVGDRDDYDDSPPPVFHAGMLPSEIAEMFADTLRWNELQQVDIKALRPAAFGGLDGFRFEFRHYSQQGLHYRGLAHGAATVDGKLHLIVFYAPAIHYFDALRGDVEALFKSVQLSG